MAAQSHLYWREAEEYRDLSRSAELCEARILEDLAVRFDATADRKRKEQNDRADIQTKTLTRRMAEDLRVRPRAVDHWDC